MKTGYTHISVLADRSGSMRKIIEDMKGGLITFINEQKKEEGDLTLTFAQFDSRYEKVLNFLKVEKSTEIDLSQYIPRGSTALIDSLCQLIDETGQDIAKMQESERPEKVLFIVITDGEENASREFRITDLKSRIQLQENQYKWSFVFLGANIDSFATGSGYGMRRAATMDFVPTQDGISNMFMSVSSSTKSYRSRASGQELFAFEDKK